MSDIPLPPPAQPAYGGAVPSVPLGGPEYASWLSRVGANLLDGLVNFAVAIPLLAPGIAILIASSDPGAFDPETGTYTGGGPSPLGIGLVVLGYLAVFVFAIWNFVIRQGRKGQTLGKTWLHIKVVREANGDVPGVWLALGRYLLQSILTPLTLYLNLLWPLWDAKNQTLHDKVCGTVVIRVS
jgi:uncharacterized RDD family membrane protein YckC